MTSIAQTALKICASLLLTTLGAGSVASATQMTSSAVVLVSGGGATTPFTTPNQICAKGFPAGSTSSYLREGLLKAGYKVYTAPAQTGAGQISTDTTAWGFDQCPPALPAEMTVNAVGDIDEAGQRLAAFIMHLHQTYNITNIDVVGHSMGGLFSRSAFKALQLKGSPVRIRSLTTVGTPWEGAFAADYATGGAVKLIDCMGDAACENSLKEFKAFWLPHSTGAGQQVTRAYLTGPNGWNERQGSVLKGIPVVLIGGDYFKTSAANAKPEVWPHDALVSLRSALATDVPDAVLPHRRCATVADVHSIYFAKQYGLPEAVGITFDPRTLNLVIEALKNAPQALSQPNRLGCPAPR